VVPDQKRETVAVTIRIDEGPPIRVDTLTVDIGDVPESGRPKLDRQAVVPLKPGDVFDQKKYDEGRSHLLAWARRAQYARATVTKQARVDVPSNTATITYTIHLGPLSFFGPVSVEGLERVTTDVVLREVTFDEGAPFDPKRLERTRRNLLRLRL